MEGLAFRGCAVGVVVVVVLASIKLCSVKKFASTLLCSTELKK
jgi:hypothetical protein